MTWELFNVLTVEPGWRAERSGGYGTPRGCLRRDSSGSDLSLSKGFLQEQQRPSRGEKGRAVGQDRSQVSWPAERPGREPSAFEEQGRKGRVVASRPGSPGKEAWAGVGNSRLL